MAKKFVRTTKSVWESKTDDEKKAYNDSIVFVTEEGGTSGSIWSNGLYYINAGPKGDQGPQGNPGLNGAFSAQYEQSTETLILDGDLEDGFYNTEFINVTNTVMQLEPNKYYCWSTPISQLTITLQEPLNTDILNIYTFEFTTSENGCTLLLQDTIKWAGGIAPNIDYNTTYQISITNNLAIIQDFNYAQ